MELAKAWDKDALVEALKAQGMPVLEDTAEKLVATMIEWTEKSVMIQGGIVAMITLPLLAAAKPEIKKALDKIDSQPG